MEENIMQRFAKSEATTTARDRENLRQKLAQDVEAYLAGGGQITTLPAFARADRPLDRGISLVKTGKKERAFSDVKAKRDKQAFELEAIAQECWENARVFYTTGNVKGYILRENPYGKDIPLSDDFDAAMDMLLKLVEDNGAEG